MIWFVSFLLGIAGLVLGLNWLFPGSITGQGDRMELAYGLVLLTVIGSSLVLGWRTSLRETAKYILIWVGLFLGVATLYAYQDGFRALALQAVSTLAPAEPVSEDGAVKIRASADGHFSLFASVNGSRVRFLVDTGATEVVLTRNDAKRAGIDLDGLAFNEPVRTANGLAYVAHVRLKEIQVGDILVKGVDASVAGDGLDQSLLGMSYLRRLSSYEFTKRELILRK